MQLGHLAVDGLEDAPRMKRIRKGLRKPGLGAGGGDPLPPRHRGLPGLPRRGERLHAHRAGVAEAMLQAMSPLVPDKTIAEGSGSGAIALGGRARDGKRSYVQHEIFAGGVGRNGKDGASATSFHLSNGKIAPVEIIESEFPTQVERFELLRDSGVRGRHRGGLGFVREYRILQDEVRFSMRTDKHALAPQGIDGGHPGGTGDCIINPHGDDERSLPSRFGDQRLKTRDVLRVERPGGGGVGAAFERSPEAVLEDVRQGYVSVERARSEYGVVVRARGGEVTLDLDTTRELRGKQNGGAV